MATPIIADRVSAQQPRNGGLLQISGDQAEGAQACLTMLSTIYGLGRVRVQPQPELNPDDGKRMDYAGADAVVASTLDKYASNAGFRQALANFLLTGAVDAMFNVNAWTPEDLFTDNSYRNYPKVWAPEARPSPADDMRRNLSFSAAAEIEVLGRTLRDQMNGDGFEYLLNSALIRINALSSVILSIHGGDDGRDISEMHEVVFGERPGRD